MTSNTERAELVSWKEIASYLGISVKTAQVWERDPGLPVRRLPGGRARVLAYSGELDAWKCSHPDPTPALSSGSSSSATVISPPKATQGSHTRWWYAIASLTLVILIAGIAWARFRLTPVPSSYRVEENTLIVAGADGRELWRHTFAESLSREAYLPADLDISPRAWFGDLDGNGRHDVLFVLQPRETGHHSTLYCFGPDGRERWHFVPGHNMSTRAKTFVPEYRIQQFAVASVGHDQHLRVVVTSCHYLYYPSQIVLLNADGKLVREYWHAGHLGHLAIGDPDGQGTNRIYLGGINNARHGATLVVLDPDQFGGAAIEDDPDYQFLGQAPGHEEARVLFPRSCINQRMERYNGVANLAVRPGGITVDVHERYGLPRTVNILYELTPSLQVRTLTLSDTFLPHHALLQRNGDLDHAFSTAERDDLRLLDVLPSRAH